MLLGKGVFLKYVLREPDDGVVRFLGVGRIAREGLNGIQVYDAGEALKAELSCAAIRSWNVIGPNGKSIDSHIEVSDFDRLA